MKAPMSRCPDATNDTNLVPRATRYRDTDMQTGYKIAVRRGVGIL